MADVVKAVDVKKKEQLEKRAAAKKAPAKKPAVKKAKAGLFKRQTKAKTTKLLSLKKMASRNFWISLVLFAVLLGSVFATLQRVSSDLGSLTGLYGVQLKLERFRGVLSNVLLPMNDYALTQNKKDIVLIRQANKDFLSLYKEVVGLSHLTATDLKELRSIRGLMAEVANSANDIIAHKIPDRQIANVVALSQSMVFAAKKKTNKILARLDGSVHQEMEQHRNDISMMAALNVAVILLIVVLLGFLNRVFVKNITARIAAISPQVSRVADDILHATTVQNEASETQLKTVAKVIDDLGRLSAQSKKVAMTALNVERIADGTMDSANDGAKAVHHAIISMNVIRDEVNIIADKVTFASRKSEQILESVDAVQEIAEETHLLSLNASIESAAAGEFGKRFAVVAGEVRKLADRVREFTEYIETVIHEVHGATHESVAVTREGLLEVSKGVEIAEQAGQVLTNMQKMTKKTDHAVRVIAQATVQQNKSNEEFQAVMQEMKSLLTNVAMEMQKTRESSYRLNDVANELERLL